MDYDVEINGRARQVTLQRAGNRFDVTVDGRAWTIDPERIDDHTWSLLIDRPAGRSYEVVVCSEGISAMRVSIGAKPMSVIVRDRRRSRLAERSGPSPDQSSPERIVAPMPGKVVRVLVRAGDPVRARQPIVVVEAMKMENELRANRDGVVAEVYAREAQSVDSGTLLALIATPKHGQD